MYRCTISWIFGGETRVCLRNSYVLKFNDRFCLMYVMHVRAAINKIKYIYRRGMERLYVLIHLVWHCSRTECFQLKHNELMICCNRHNTSDTYSLLSHSIFLARPPCITNFFFHSLQCTNCTIRDRVYAEFWSALTVTSFYVTNTSKWEGMSQMRASEWKKSIDKIWRKMQKKEKKK